MLGGGGCREYSNAKKWFIVNSQLNQKAKIHKVKSNDKAPRLFRSQLRAPRVSPYTFFMSSSFLDVSEHVRDSLARFWYPLYTTTETYAVGVFSLVRRLLALLVVFTATEALLFCLWFTALLPIWRRIGPKVSLCLHLGTTFLVLWRLFVARDAVLSSCFGDLGMPSWTRNFLGASLLAWTSAQKPAAIPVGAFGASLIGNYGVSWVACAIVVGCYQLYARVPKPTQTMPEQERTRIIQKGALERESDVDQIVDEVINKVSKGDTPSGLRRRQKLTIPTAFLEKQEQDKQPPEKVERAFVDSFAQEEAVPE